MVWGMECTVCFETYTISGDRAPRVLHCGHTFCTLCVKKLPESGRLSCPTCRISTTTAQVQPNYAILNLLSENAIARQERSFCRRHRSETVEVFCRVCSFFVCPKCYATQSDPCGGHSRISIEAVTEMVLALQSDDEVLMWRANCEQFAIFAAVDEG
eukprot:GHVN01041396.1.p1 GENE.GHVN01041396.1~~GHVN01041396.1.p1  ORF type:complete len:157 (+),score=7.14 GHVN01041396.1:555-1025(+)